MTTTQIQELAAKYKAATDEFYIVASKLTPEQLNQKKPGGSQSDWTPRQVIHHMMDSESTSMLRLRRLIAEPGSIIQGYDEGKWSANKTLGYEELPIENSLALFAAVREASYQLIKRLTPEQLQNICIHSESGEFSVEKWLNAYTNHPLDHLGQIKEAL